MMARKNLTGKELPMNNATPNEANLLEHEIDGIKELDNLLPRWWVWLFNFTIIFSVIYMIYYHVAGAGDLQAAEYTKEWQRGEAIKSASIAKFEAGIATLAPATNQPALNEGQQLFITYCAPCHRPDGGGLVGPNLCDGYWIHGSNFVDNVKTIINGVPAKGMLAWRGVLNPDQIKAVSSYIYTLRGTSPPNPKPAENTVTAPTGPSEFE
jgi:cytochrome c oxidase cbb3-type subunit 3